VDVWFRIEPAAVEVTVADDGPAFNLLLQPEPDVTSPLQTRQPGGLGISLVKSLMDEVRYERTNRNVLTIRKRLIREPRDTPRESMNIQQAESDGVMVLAPAGRIDTTTSAAVEEAVRRAVDDGARRLVIDFAAVEYISSAGLRVFLVLAKRMRDLRGRLVLCGMPEPVSQVFRLAGFMTLFQVEATREAALATIGAPA
jgi:anti-anti-sigma factor